MPALPVLNSTNWARDHLLAGCLSFSVFTFLAWLCAALNDHFLYATLSEMVHDWSTPEGKIFIPAMLLPAIFYLLSSHPYILPNVRAEGHPYNRVFVVLRHFFVNSGLILCAFVPTLQTIDSHAHQVEVYIHSLAATLAFGSFLAAELFVISCNRELTEDETRVRQWSLMVMLSCLILCLGHKSLVLVNFWSSYSEAWTFRYEMLVGSGLITQNMVIWFFSDPNPELREEKYPLVYKILGALPHLGALGVVASDFLYRGNRYALPWLMLEVVFFILAMVISWHTLELLRVRGEKSWPDQKQLTTGAGYGSASSA